ncbi:potassium channel family protein [Synechococcus elongatus]|nr:potassium channel protein [Synechococcus elongatus]AJD56616.1 potassium transporter TrkA [Synechococcus elongatus UTEX 2973]MBD2588168.1 potassium channel protein [Synechococcus elongatus FACHB-242]MBD2689236.1 potassium channel protein [Synechococcus elongatus FACHB-1061]MBD2707124.1 potassium channel protein [Synechococcus elongatus PCC 7942 = FACHB-805]UOW70086.1 potassium transporter TrkA [Synechococcus elongatus PCC 7943]
MTAGSPRRSLPPALRKVVIGGLFFLATQAIAILGYWLSGWSLLDAIYMVVITIFGVGYGEVRPINTPALRIFTIFVILAGTSSAVYLIGGLAQLVTEGEIRRALGVRRMTREIRTLQRHVIVCGFGRIGQTLARKVTEASLPVIVIDTDETRIRQAEEQGFLALRGSATDEAILIDAGVERAATIATALPDDAANVFITLTARGLNPNLTIIARGELPATEKKLLQAGADRVVLPATIGALRMAHLITHPAALNLLESSDSHQTLNELLGELDIQMDELAIAPQSPLIGHRLGAIEVSGKGAFIIVALRRATGEMILRPGSDLFLHAGDTLIVIGHSGDLPRFAKHYALQRQVQYRGVRQRS